MESKDDSKYRRGAAAPRESLTCAVMAGDRENAAQIQSGLRMASSGQEAISGGWGDAALA
jgi:hypothetical protein